MRRSIPVPFTLTLLALTAAMTACSTKSSMLASPEGEQELRTYEDSAVSTPHPEQSRIIAEADPSDDYDGIGGLMEDAEELAADSAPVARSETAAPLESRRDRAAKRKVAEAPSLDLAMGRSVGPAGGGSTAVDSLSAGAVGTTGQPQTTQVAPQPIIAAPPSAPRHTSQPGPVFAGEGYTHYGINPFVATADDHLSTFAVDVDTASYTNTRRKLNEGYLPPESAVRVEEFVNYLPYDYAPPRDGSPFAVHFEAAPSPWNSGYHVLEVGVQGKKVGMTQRKPVHLTFLIDTSGSMRSDDKLGLVKKAMDMLTRELEDGDTVAIATYAGSTKVVLQPTPVSQRGQILSSLQRLVAGGSTAMASGIDNAYSLANSTYVSGHVNRVIVCSDGDANVGTTSHAAISSQIRGYAERGITLTTLGFGNGNYQDTMMERLANDGDGNYFYIDSEKEARRVLVDKMTSTMEVIAKDVKIQVDFDPDQVLAYRLVGYENRDIADVDFRNDKVDAGEIGSGHQVTALYEVQLAPGADDGWATARVRAKAPGPDAPATERAYGLSGRDVKGSMAQTSRDFRIALAAGTFADVLRGGADWEGVSLQQVLDLARSGKRAEYAEDAELIELIRTAARLRGEGSLAQR